MRKLTVKLQWSPTNSIVVGQLAHHDQRMYFEYDQEFLPKNLPLSPFKLPVRPGLTEHLDHPFGPLPGMIDDSLPDGWGLLLMDRFFRRRGINSAEISPLDRLSYLGTRTMGALTYHPCEPQEPNDEMIDLHELGKNAQEVYSGAATEVLPQLMRAGGSPAGARPKVLVGIRGGRMLSGEHDLPKGFMHWIVKFSSKDDSRDAGPIEFAYSNMARAAGIDMPETRLFKAGRRTAYFGVRRFDRGPGNTRIHLHTFGNIIQTNFRIPSTDYTDLLKVTLALTRNRRDLLQIFRRMIFNIAAHNRDDHAKNFAFVMNQSGQWSLSPAYDLVFADGPGGEHTMTVMGEGKSPKRDHVLKLAKEFGIAKKVAVAMIDEVNDAISRWRKFAENAGCTKKSANLIESNLRTV